MPKSVETVRRKTRVNEMRYAKKVVEILMSQGIIIKEEEKDIMKLISF